MNARNFVNHEFRDTGGPEAGMHGEIAEQTPEDCLRVAMYCAAEAPFQCLGAKRMSCLQSVAQALPQVRLAEGLERLNITMNPFVIVKDGSPFAIVDEVGTMRLTRNVPKEERDRVLAYDVSQLDDARKNRISFYLDQNQLDASPGSKLPAVNQETKAMLQGKCAADGPALPMLRTGAAHLPIFNEESTVTIVTGDPAEINPKLYDPNLGYGILLPLSDAFVGALNDGAIQRFSYSVYPAADDNALEISVQFTLDGEVFSHTTTRTTSTYEGAAFAVCSFGKWGAYTLCNDAALTLSPAEQTMVPSFAGTTWRVSRIRGGVRYVALWKDGTPLGVVELPDGPEQKDMEQVTLAFDLGDTSFCGISFTDPETPIPIHFDCAQDVLPLVISSKTDTEMMCDGSWLPVIHNGSARSISQMFHDADGNSFKSPAPYMVARPFINHAEGYSIEHSAKNGLYAGFKSRGIIHDLAKENEAKAYRGATAAILLLGLHQALQFSGNVNLRLSHPNNPGYKDTFANYINSVLALISESLTDHDGNGFEFSEVEYIDEASCNVACVYKKGINGQLGTYFVNHIASDMGGSTTDVSICCGQKKILLPAIAIAGRVVTIHSFIEIARLVNGDSNGLIEVLQNVSGGMKTIVSHQIGRTNKLLEAGVDTKTALVQMVDDAEMAESMQTLFDYFPPQLDREKSQLLQSLVCFKDLLVNDLILHQASRFFTEDDLADNPLYLLRLGNGSRCIDLICGEESPFNNSRDVLKNVLHDRAMRWVKRADLLVIHNKKPKTEVTQGLSCYSPEDGAGIERWQDDTTVTSVKDLGESYLEDAVKRTMEVVTWLSDVVPRICGETQPLYSFGLTGGFHELVKDLEKEVHVKAALKDTLQHENGRFGGFNQLPASLAIDLWVAFSVMDHVNRQLADVQVKQMNRAR